jgi:hypothetical protein
METKFSTIAPHLSALLQTTVLNYLLPGSSIDTVCHANRKRRTPASAVLPEIRPLGARPTVGGLNPFLPMRLPLEPDADE